MMIPDLMLSKLYANSLLTSLNSRSKLGDDRDSTYQVESNCLGHLPVLIALSRNGVELMLSGEQC